MDVGKREGENKVATSRKFWAYRAGTQGRGQARRCGAKTATNQDGTLGKQERLLPVMNFASTAAASLR